VYTLIRLFTVAQSVRVALRVACRAVAILESGSVEKEHMYQLDREFS
jgi:hypothetical protein